MKCIYKNGFTLVELIAVIIILSLIAIIAFPAILNIVRDSENQIDESSKEIILTQAKAYVNDNVNDFAKVNGNSYCVSINSLATSGFLTSEFINNLSEENQKLNVSVSVSDYNYNYEIVSDC